MLPLILLLFFFAFGDVFVVEREKGSLAVIKEDKLVEEIKGLGNLNHATLKFFKGYGYLISRDGYLSKIDPRNYKLLKKVKVGESTIGLNFCGDKVLVANYSPKDVVILNTELKILRRIKTGSRNVGIKGRENLFVYALMDKDTVEIRRCDNYGLLRSIPVGKMPFDAFLYGDIYVVGFFLEEGIGLINLRNFSYKKVLFKAEGKEVVFKIPHFGFWGVWEEKAYIPAVGERKIHVISLRDFSYLGSIEVKGLPVFVRVSPDGKYLAVNYSGDTEDYLTLIDLREKRVLKTKALGKRILHFRFTRDGRFIYLSSYYEGKLKKVSVPELEVVKEISVPTPSGVFIYGGE
ncbi:hypothetical protein JCM9492_10850 [Aquifex pyrophilus]